MPIASGAWELLRPYYLRWVYFRRYPSARPPHFAACWRYPNSPIGEMARPSTDRPGVVFFPMNDWHTRFQRTQQLAVAAPPVLEDLPRQRDVDRADLLAGVALRA